MAHRRSPRRPASRAGTGAPPRLRRQDRSRFLGPDFLLQTRQAQALYHDIAERLPIIDFHSHLSPEDIARDRRFDNLTQIWLAGDHYKWRAMRANGVPERCITGDAPDREKFQRWAETVPRCLRNPLYHWTHLELQRPFGIHDRLLGPETAEEIWHQANASLATPPFTARGILTQMHVLVVCTTDDPADSLAHHAALRASSFPVQIRPTWRPDRAAAIEDVAAWNAYCDRLGEASATSIRTWDDLQAALQRRHDHFHAAGCRLSDHGLDTIPDGSWSERAVAATVAAARAGTAPSPEQAAAFRLAMLITGARMDHAKGWVQQFHIGALRNANTRQFRQLGPDHGYDSIDDRCYARPLARLLDALDQEDRLAKTILYNLNPRDNEVIATMIGNFQDGRTPGKMQMGSAWWFLDQKDGMERQMDALSQMGLLSRFVGMLTDSRSFLSFTRHEYFRRILCATLGQEMAQGLLPDDLGLVGELVRDVCYGNAARYFDFGLPALPARAGA